MSELQVEKRKLYEMKNDNLFYEWKNDSFPKRSFIREASTKDI